jgi:hypothetical protein
MAVIKIVPMPGAVGDKGDEGAVGPQGPQGAQGAQGPAGADALWSYNGEYNPGAGYAVGDVVTYQGQLWYRKHANGGNVGDTPSEGFIWDLLAAKGTDSIVPTSGTWETNISLRSGIVGGVYPSTDSLGRYYTIGDLVYVEVHFAVAQPTSWGSDSFIGELPFKIAGSWQDDVSSATMRHRLRGQLTVRGDAEPFGIPYDDNEENYFPVDIVLIPNLTEGPDTFLITAEDEVNSPNTNVNSSRVVTQYWPVNLNVPNNSNSPYFSLRFSGMYRKA